MTPVAAAAERVRALVEAARRLADPRDPLGIEARAVLPGATGLSPEGVARALSECLETRPSAAEVALLCASVPEAPRAHVALSANVFVAAHRAIALALAASPAVEVRPSRREPEMASLLARAAPGLFLTVERLAPLPGDHLWAYGSDATIAALRADLPSTVTLHAHGHGFGVVVIDLAARAGADVEHLARVIARDVALFDQRGCLSPRIVFAAGSEDEVRRFAEQLATGMEEAERATPLGLLGAEERADARRYRDTVRFAQELIPAGSGAVGLDVRGGPLVVPPVGRHVHVVRTEEIERSLAPLSGVIAAVGVDGPPGLAGRVAELLPGARPSAAGLMQRPPFDGPVDRRTGVGITVHSVDSER
jgi:hypothetical protein